MSVTPNDPLVVQALVNDLNSLIGELGSYLDTWQTRVDATIVKLQNAGESEELPDGSIRGQVPSAFQPPEETPDEPQPVDEQPVDYSSESSTEPTETSTEPPEDTTTVSDPFADER